MGNQRPNPHNMIHEQSTSSSAGRPWPGQPQENHHQGNKGIGDRNDFGNRRRPGGGGYYRGYRSNMTPFLAAVTPLYEQ